MSEMKDCFYETYRYHKENKIKGIELVDVSGDDLINRLWH